jgi:hypothetical protein
MRERETMPFRANVFKVMIASPGDVTEERTIVTEEVSRWNDVNATTRQLVLLPVKWETHSTPEYGAHPQTIINRQLLEDADIVVAIFGTRIGTPTEEYVSGTVEEIKTHVASGKTAKIYFSDVAVSPSVVNPVQYASVQEFKKECQSSSLYAGYKTLDQFRTDFKRHLELELNHPKYRWLAMPEPARQEADQVTGSNPTVKSLDDAKLRYARSRMESLKFFDRDFLRFLLLHGDSRGDTIWLAAKNKSGVFDLGAVSRAAVERGLVRRVEDHINGHPTFFLNPNLQDALRDVLFPRMEEEPSFFVGLDD